MKEKYFLAIDCGTQSLRTILFDTNGHIAGRYKTEYKPYFSVNPGWAEQDVSVWWNALVTGCSALKAAHPAEFAALAGVGVTTQRDSIILIDKNGVPLRPAIIWLDTRAARGPFHPRGLVKAGLQAAGMYGKVLKMQSAGRINWIRENEPHIWEKTAKVLMVSGYFNYRLTGNACDAAASLVGHIPFSHRRRDWAPKNDIPALIFPLETDRKCAVLETADTAGVITAAASAETGIPAGIPVIACGSDKACETTGMGAVNPGLASLSFGTTATVEVCTPRYMEPVPFMPAYCAAYPHSWVPEIEIFRGYWMISWFRDELGYEERAKATATGILPEKLMDKLLDATPPGCHGLMLQPYWGASLKDDYAKGSMVGFGDVHGKHAMYRAIVEGLAYSLREGLETLEKRGRFTCGRVAVSGGASQSDRVCRIAADILNRPLVRGVTTETSALGAAVITAAGTGAYASIDEAISRMVKYEKTFEPTQQYRDLYDGLYGVYKKIYPALQDAYKSIQHITNYPETDKENN